MTTNGVSLVRRMIHMNFGRRLGSTARVAGLTVKGP
jgi:hypothetical protein